jgi:hypothetical protein
MVSLSFVIDEIPGLNGRIIEWVWDFTYRFRFGGHAIKDFGNGMLVLCSVACLISYSL